MGIVNLFADMTYEGGASINFASNGRPTRPLMGVWLRSERRTPELRCSPSELQI
jgi:hypothetical protein